MSTACTLRPYAAADEGGAIELWRRTWQQPKPRYTRGVLAKYAKLVSTASEGAVTDKYL